KRADSDHDGTKDGAEDYDGDKLTNLTEQRAGTNAGKRDSDGDGIADGREDSDHDGLKNLAEQQTGNDPGARDSDGDGTLDGSENAGRIVSYSGGALTLLLSSTGKTVTAPVTGGTDVECNMVSDYTAVAPVDPGTADDDSDYDDDDGPSLDDDDPSYDDDAGDDDAGDDTSDDSGDDDPTADASRVTAHAADDGDADLADDSSDDTGDDDGSADDADAPDVPDTSDPCVAQGLVAGAWVHESEISAGDDGDPAAFDEVALVADLG
ncbi:MAG TPA: hypothetical protein VGM33_08070, partial [Baekduia sp.]